MSDRDDQSPAGSSTSQSNRMHLSGLNPAQCSLKDLQDRFKSFGLTVSEVHNWPPLPNAVDQPTDWCFLTLNGEESKIKRAVDLLHGTLWKGKKFRISKAKERAWQANEDKSEKVREEKQKKKRRKGIEGIESEKINIPVSAKDVEKGEWGWKKTPAGHLIRPMHMRPDHPLPRPVIAKVDENDKEKDSIKKMKRKNDIASKPLSRAKRITIDPSRYGAIHLSSMMLEDASIMSVPEQNWSFEEDESKTTGKWILRDEKGDEIMSEYVILLRPNLMVPRSPRSDYSASISPDQGEDDDYMFDEIDAAIDQASSISDSDDREDKEMVDEMDDHFMKDFISNEDGSRTMEIVYPHYDPNEEDAFSDGYQEMTKEQYADVNTNPRMESQVHMALLKRMFGESALKTVRTEEVRKETSAFDDDKISEIASEEKRTEEEIQEQTPMSIDKDSQPSTDYTKVDSTRDEPQPAEGSLNSTHTSKQHQKEEGIQMKPGDDRVEMTTLTDMFKPKENKGGFSIMANLDLDLDDEFNFEPDIDEGETDAVQHSIATRTQEVAPIYTTYPTVKKQIPVFPSLDPDGFIRTNGTDFISTLARQLQQKDPSLIAFFRDDDPEILSQKWEERKSTLTQVYKRRHREALKKKKRKYTGSRAAGTALPGRRII